MHIVLGSTGQLGSYISKYVDQQLLKIIPREDFNSWVSNGDTFIKKSLESIINASESTENYIYFCIGETNSIKERDLLEFTNCIAPILIARNIQGLPLRLVTFGSIHELTTITNPYMDSKKKLFKKFLEFQSDVAWSHFQLHTLYSEQRPKSHMFLGQLLESLEKKRPFEMSSGLQLRQFHHTEDVAKIALGKISSHVGVALEEINGPEFISLRELAEFIFYEFSLSDLLQIGARPDEISEVFAASQKGVENIDSRLFRDMKSGILQMLNWNLPGGT